MSKKLTVFFAHPSGASEEEIRLGMARIKEGFEEKAAQKGATLRVRVVPGRDDFRECCRGDWSLWAKRVVARRDAVTMKRLYHVYVVPSDVVGRATADIIEGAITANLPVFRLLPKKDTKNSWGSLQRITQVYAYDPEDWSSGFRCTGKEKEDGVD